MIASFWVRMLSRMGIKRLIISFGSILLLFFMKVAGDHPHRSW